MNPISSRGFTLAETVIVVGFAAVIMVVIGLLIYMFGKMTSYEQATSLSSGSASAVMREIELLTVPADAVVSSHAFSIGTYTSSASTLVLEIPSIDSTGTTIASTYDYAVFFVSGTNAYRRIEANAASRRTTGTVKLSSTINTLSFTYNNADFTQVSSVTTDVQTRATTRQDTATDHRHETITLRNF